MPERHGVLAARLGLTDGQVGTLGLGLALGIATLVLGLPPVLRQAEHLDDALATPIVDDIGPVPAITVEEPAGVASMPMTPAPSTIATPAVPARPTLVAAAAPAPPAAGPVPRAVRPLVVVESGWARSRGVTDVLGAEIREDELPVGATLGREDYRSFVRVDGDTTTLRLPIAVDHAANRGADGALVRACANTDAAWTAGGDQAPGDAPPFDESACVDGVRDGDAFTFDVGAFDRGAGLSLLPGAGDPSWAIVLRRSSV